MVDLFSNLPVINITNEVESYSLDQGTVLVKATSNDNSSIVSIKVYKGGEIVAKIAYKSSLRFTADFGEVYIIKVSNSNKEERTKNITIDYNPREIVSTYNLLGSKAQILVRANTDPNYSISRIEISGNGISESVDNQNVLETYVQSNGIYEVKVTDSAGYEKTERIELTGIGGDFYIDLEIDESKLESKGVTTITATASETPDTFFFGDKALTNNPATITVTKDGEYIFTATKGSKTAYSNVRVTIFSSLDTSPRLKISVEDKTLNIVATPLFGTSIKSIEILKDGVSLKKLNYKSMYNYEVPEEVNIIQLR